MCLYPKLVKNPKYRPNKKNGGQVPPLADDRLLYVPIGCQKCIECKKKKAREWNVRLHEEIRTNNKATFVTLTFSNESISGIIGDLKGQKCELEGYDLDNEIATIATRRFLERWRKKTKKSIKHWLITELGHKGTENIHLHGLIWSTDINLIKNTWQYGWTYTGYSCNEKTINYITKYVTKIDKDHKNYNAKILTSSGIGKGYNNRPDSLKNKFNPKSETNELYRDRKGFKKAMPIYYRNKLYSEDEREILWLEKLDKMERYVLGKKIDISHGQEEYDKAVNAARAKNNRLGYGSPEQSTAEKKKYENDKRNLLILTRLKNAKNTKED